MANFNTNRYPWPTVDHDGANAQTGGNTRLLFAEQDNYRTRKGAEGIIKAIPNKRQSGVNSVINAQAIAIGSSGYLGAHTDDATADAAAGGSAALNDFYWNITDSRFRRSQYGFWRYFIPHTDVIEVTIDETTYNISIAYPNSTQFRWDAIEAVFAYIEADTTSQNNITDNDVTYVIYNNLDNGVYLVYYEDEIIYEDTFDAVLGTNEVKPVSSGTGFRSVEANDSDILGPSRSDWYYKTTASDISISDLTVSGMFRGAEADDSDITSPANTNWYYQTDAHGYTIGELPIGHNGYAGVHANGVEAYDAVTLLHLSWFYQTQDNDTNVNVLTSSSSGFRGVHAADTDVTSPANRDWYFNTTNDEYRIYNGTLWAAALTNFVTGNSGDSTSYRILGDTGIFDNVNALESFIRVDGDVNYREYRYIFFDESDDTVKQLIEPSSKRGFRTFDEDSWWYYENGVHYAGDTEPTVPSGNIGFGVPTTNTKIRILGLGTYANAAAMEASFTAEEKANFDFATHSPELIHGGAVFYDESTGTVHRVDAFGSFAGYRQYASSEITLSLKNMPTGGDFLYRGVIDADPSPSQTGDWYYNNSEPSAVFDTLVITSSAYIGERASDPASGTANSFYWNTVDEQFKTLKNSVWTVLETGDILRFGVHDWEFAYPSGNNSGAWASEDAVIATAADPDDDTIVGSNVEPSSHIYIFHDSTAARYLRQFTDNVGFREHAADTPGSIESSELVANTIYHGQHANDGAATTAAGVNLDLDDIYWNTGTSRFKRFGEGSWFNLENDVLVGNYVLLGESASDFVFADSAAITNYVLNDVGLLSAIDGGVVPIAYNDDDDTIYQITAYTEAEIINTVSTVELATSDDYHGLHATDAAAATAAGTELDNLDIYFNTGNNTFRAYYEAIWQDRQNNFASSGYFYLGESLTDAVFADSDAIRDAVLASGHAQNAIDGGVVTLAFNDDDDKVYQVTAYTASAVGSITSNELATNTQYHGQHATDAAAATAGGSNLNDSDFYWNTTDNRFKRYLSSAWSNLANNSGVGAFRIISESATDFVFADLDAIRDGVLANSNAQIAIDGGDSIIAYNGGDSKVYRISAYTVGAVGSITSSEYATNTIYHGIHATNAAAETAGGTDLDNNDFYWNTTDNRYKRYIASSWQSANRNNNFGSLFPIENQADLDDLVIFVTEGPDHQVIQDGLSAGHTVIVYIQDDSKVYQVTGHGLATIPGSITSSALATNSNYHGQHATDAAASTAGGGALTPSDFYWSTTDNRYRIYASGVWETLDNAAAVGDLNIYGESGTDFLFEDSDAITAFILASNDAQDVIDNSNSVVVYNDGDDKVYEVTDYTQVLRGGWNPSQLFKVIGDGGAVPLGEFADIDDVLESITSDQISSLPTDTTVYKLVFYNTTDGIVQSLLEFATEELIWTAIDTSGEEITSIVAGTDQALVIPGGSFADVNTLEQSDLSEETYAKVGDTSLGLIFFDQSDSKVKVVDAFAASIGFREYNGNTWLPVSPGETISDGAAMIFGDQTNGSDFTSDELIALIDDETLVLPSEEEKALTTLGAVYADTSESKAYSIVSFTPASLDISLPPANDVFYVIPRVVSADIAETTENIPIEFLKGSLSANKAQAGAQTYGNGFSIAASEQGLHLFLRTLCNSRSGDIEVITHKDSDADGNADSPRRDVLPDEIKILSALEESNFANKSEITDIEDTIVSQLRVAWYAEKEKVNKDIVLEVQIDGYDHSGVELREIMLLTIEDLVDTTDMAVIPDIIEGGKFSDFYFAKGPKPATITVSGNQPANSSLYTQGNIDLYYQDRWTEVTFNQQDRKLLPGWTIEVRKGTIPFTYVGVSPNEASIALSRDTALQLDVTTIAFDSLPYTDMGGKRVDLDTGKGSEGVKIKGNQAKGDLDFVDASETLFTGWQAYLDLVEPGTADSIRIPLTDATFSINHQLDQAQLIVGDRRPGPAFRGTLRDVMLDGTILFTRERDWVDLFRNNVDFKNPVVVLRNAPAGGFPYELHIELGIGQLMSSPDPQVSDLGLITQAFNMKFRESASGRSDDFRFKIVTDKWVFSDNNETLGGLRVDGVYATPSS